jgi:hypothetical protein
VSAAFIAVILALVLSACGGSSSSKTTSVKASASTTGPGRAPGAFGGRLVKLRECLQKNGINVPQHPSGAAGVGGLLGGPGGLRSIPKGVSRAEYEAVLKKCGGLPLLRGGTRGFGRVQSPQFKAGLAKFESCMSANGIKLPPPNTSGKGPIFNTKGVDTTSAQFRTATSKCASQLQLAFRRTPVAPGAPGASGGAAPPGAGEPPTG